MNLINECPPLSAHQVVVNVYLSGGGFLEVVHAADKRAFSGAAGSDYYKLFTFLDMKVDSLQNFKISEAFMYIFQTYHRAVLSLCSLCSGLSGFVFMFRLYT